MEVPEAVHLRYMDATLRFRQKYASLLADGKRGISLQAADRAVSIIVRSSQHATVAQEPEPTC